MSTIMPIDKKAMIGAIIANNKTNGQVPKVKEKRR